MGTNSKTENCLNLCHPPNSPMHKNDELINSIVIKFLNHRQVYVYLTNWWLIEKFGY